MTLHVWSSQKGSLLAFVLAILVVLTTANPAQAIIIRDDVDDAEYIQSDDAYPAVFEIFAKRGGVATLIAPQWAITAGHVGQDIPLGHELTIAGQSYTVRRVVLHPEWETNRREMALFELDRPVQSVAPIAPYSDSNELGELVTFVGRGDTGTGLTGAVTADHKLRAATNRVERVEGGTLVFIFNAPGDANVTPLEGVSGAGDSGGPALIATADGLRVAGLSVASSGRPPGRYGNTEFYSRVSPDLDWINDTMLTTAEFVPDVASDVGAPAASDSGENGLSNVSIYVWIAAVFSILALAVFAYRYSRHRRTHAQL